MKTMSHYINPADCYQDRIDANIILLAEIDKEIEKELCKAHCGKKTNEILLNALKGTKRDIHADIGKHYCLLIKESA
jgi:hypothetical protein